MNTFEIHQAGMNKFEDAFYLLERFFSEEGFDTSAEVMRSSLHAMIIDPKSAVFVAQHKEKSIGVATVTTSVGIEYGRSAELEDLYVLPEARGFGIASTLIEEVCNWCVSEGVNVLLVTVTPEGDEEHKLLDYYQRHGFTNTGRLILERTLEDRGRDSSR
jgi:aminoglycoside 6'-N-acetyltransferase I